VSCARSGGANNAPFARDQNYWYFNEEVVTAEEFASARPVWQG
jgi:hypothetical protein